MLQTSDMIFESNAIMNQWVLMLWQMVLPRVLDASYIDLDLLIRHTATIWNHSLNVWQFSYRLVHFS